MVASPKICFKNSSFGSHFSILPPCVFSWGRGSNVGPVDVQLQAVRSGSRHGYIRDRHANMSGVRPPRIPYHMACCHFRVVNQLATCCVRCHFHGLSHDSVMRRVARSDIDGIPCGDFSERFNAPTFAPML